MDEMISLLVSALLPDFDYRQEPRVHPYTSDGRQVDVLHVDRWIEVWECGLARPDILRVGGVTDRSGLALGMGLDRLLMLVKGIPDIRLLRSSDPRIAGQMLDLAPYRLVSAMPAIARDLSIAVAVDADEEILGDRIRDALGDEASCVEDVYVLSATKYDQLPGPATSRLGARSAQKNLLIRVVLRDLEATLTTEKANTLRDRIYVALHEGTEYEWAISPRSGGAGQMA
jgi:phenylalanyl-tRNA synthetase alpha chain